MAVYLVCEYQLDNRVLNELVVQRNRLNVIVAQAAGSTGLGAIRSYLEKLNAHNKAITIRDRDRDYDRTLAEADASWTDTNAKELIWRRHEIENYLLEPSIVLAFFNDIRTTATWAKDLPTTETQAGDLLWNFALPLLPAHAAELLRSEITQESNKLGATKLTRPQQITKNSDKATCREAVITEAARLRATGTALAALSELDANAVGSRYDALLASCEQPEFQNSAFLCEMGGKEILALLGQHLRTLGASARLQDSLPDELATTLARHYCPQTTFHPDDFADLATKLKSLGA